MSQIINFEEAKEYLRNKKLHIKEQETLTQPAIDDEMIEVPKQLFQEMVTRLAMYEQAKDSGRFIYKPNEGDTLS